MYTVYVALVQRSVAVHKNAEKLKTVVPIMAFPLMGCPDSFTLIHQNDIYSKPSLGPATLLLHPLTFIITLALQHYLLLLSIYVLCLCNGSVTTPSVHIFRPLSTITLANVNSHRKPCLGHSVASIVHQNQFKTRVWGAQFERQARNLFWRLFVSHPGGCCTVHMAHCLFI